jgi:hypothetical protein
MKDLTEIASISGKGGLFRIIKPGRVGVILESMDDKKIKIATNPNHKVSILADISIYTTTDDGSIPLEDILRKIHKEFGDDPGIDGKSTADELISFIEYIVPEYDESRVYPSDVKKLVNWYTVLLREFPDFFKEDKKEKKDDKKSGDELKEDSTKSSVATKKKLKTEASEGPTGNKNKDKK